MSGPNQYKTFEWNIIFISSFPALLCQAKCAYPVDIVTERVKGTIKPQQSILLEVPEFDEPLLHVRRHQNLVPRYLKLDHEHDKPLLLTQGYFYPTHNQKLKYENTDQINEQEIDLFPFAEELKTVTSARRKIADVKPSEDYQYFLKQFNKKQR